MFGNSVKTREKARLELEKATRQQDALTVRDLSVRLQVSERRARDLTHEMHMDGAIHIKRWRRESVTGPWSPAYVYGTGQDETRPVIMTSLEKQTRFRHRVRQQNKEHVLELFAKGVTMTGKEAAIRLEMPCITVQSILIELHEEEEVHVTSWRCEDRSGWSPVYHVGCQDDAPMPNGYGMRNAKHVERAQASYALQKERAKELVDRTPWKSTVRSVGKDELAMRMFPWMYGSNASHEPSHAEAQAA